MNDLIGASDSHSVVFCVVLLLCGANGAAVTLNWLDLPKPDADREYDGSPWTMVLASRPRVIGPR